MSKITLELNNIQAGLLQDAIGIQLDIALDTSIEPMFVNSDVEFISVDELKEMRKQMTDNINNISEIQQLLSVLNRKLSLNK